MTGSDVNKGVIFDKKDYAGFVKRVVIAVTDLVVIGVVAVSVFVLSEYLISDEDLHFQCNYLFVLFFSVGYLALLKRSRFRTVGYRLTGVRIVDIRGEQPSVFKMILRSLLLVLGPFELIFDTIWLTSEVTKQTLRDKYVGTYVVNQNAVPVAEGKLKTVTLGVMGWSLMYREVKVTSDMV